MQKSRGELREVRIFNYTHRLRTVFKKIHCDQCNRELSESILRIPGVKSVESYIRDERLILDCENLSEDDLADRLETMGLLIN